MKVEVGDIVQYNNKGNEYVVLKVNDCDTFGRKSYDLLALKVGGMAHKGGAIFRSHPFEPEVILSKKVKDTRLARKMFPNHEVLEDDMLRIRGEF